MAGLRGGNRITPQGRVILAPAFFVPIIPPPHRTPAGRPLARCSGPAAALPAQGPPAAAGPVPGPDAPPSPVVTYAPQRCSSAGRSPGILSGLPPCRVSTAASPCGSTRITARPPLRSTPRRKLSTTPCSSPRGSTAGCTSSAGQRYSQPPRQAASSRQASHSTSNSVFSSSASPGTGAVNASAVITSRSEDTMSAPRAAAAASAARVCPKTGMALPHFLCKVCP